MEKDCGKALRILGLDEKKCSPDSYRFINYKNLLSLYMVTNFILICMVVLYRNESYTTPKTLSFKFIVLE